MRLVVHWPATTAMRPGDSVAFSVVPAIVRWDYSGMIRIYYGKQQLI